MFTYRTKIKVFWKRSFPNTRLVRTGINVENKVTNLDHRFLVQHPPAKVSISKRYKDKKPVCLWVEKSLNEIGKNI